MRGRHAGRACASRVRQRDAWNAARESVEGIDRSGRKPRRTQQLEWRGRHEPSSSGAATRRTATSEAVSADHPREAAIPSPDVRSSLARRRPTAVRDPTAFARHARGIGQAFAMVLAVAWIVFASL